MLIAKWCANADCQRFQASYNQLSASATQCVAVNCVHFHCALRLLQMGCTEADAPGYTVQDFEDVLVYIEDTVEQDVEQLSENGTDRMFQHLSIVFTTLYHLLSYSKSVTAAEQLVSITTPTSMFT